MDALEQANLDRALAAFPAGLPFLATPRPPTVTADIGYLAATSERPYRYMFEPPTGQAWHNCACVRRSVQITDARAMVSPPAIHIEGFELWNAPTAAIDFDDDEQIQRRYYPEAAELALQATGADHAYVFDHALRRREAGRPPLTFGRHAGGGPLGAVGRAHIDYSETSGRRRLEIAALGDDVQKRIERFAIVNVWRSIGGKIVDTPLAVCDSRTVSAADLVTTDLRYRDRIGEIYLVQESPRHRWAFFPDMDRDEALVFKQYDSQVNGTARFTPHTAFDLPNIPADAPLRESIEIRCLVTFG